MPTLDFDKNISNEHIGYWMGPTAVGVLGITDVYEPLAAEINNIGGTSGMIDAAGATSWNDWSLGIEASEVLNEPSLADASTAEEFGQSNYGGNASHYYPKTYGDASNPNSVVYDLTKTPGTKLDQVVRIDGEIDSSTAATDGDFVSVFRVQSEGETNPFTPGESKRYTKSYIQKSDFSNMVVVGDHAITSVVGATATPAPLEKGRFRASQQGRDTTNSLDFSSDDAAVIQVYPGGFYEVTGVGTDTATVTMTDPGTGDTTAIAITVTV